MVRQGPLLSFGTSFAANVPAFIHDHRYPVGDAPARKGINRTGSPLPVTRAIVSMQAKELYFVIPTHRLREVGETIEHYDEHFWRNGHSVRMIVFDDSSPAAQEKYYPLLEQTRTHNELYYVG